MESFGAHLKVQRPHFVALITCGCCITATLHSLRAGLISQFDLSEPCGEGEGGEEKEEAGLQAAHGGGRRVRHIRLRRCYLEHGEDNM